MKSNSFLLSFAVLNLGLQVLNLKEIINGTAKDISPVLEALVQKYLLQSVMPPSILISKY